MKTSNIKALLTVFVYHFFCSSSFSQTVSRKEFIGRPTKNSITIQLIFSEAAEVSIQYGTASGNLTSQTQWYSFVANDPAEIVVSGLQPDTKYYYLVLHRRPGSSIVTTRPEYSFHTQRAPGSRFSFVIEADPHLDEQSDTALYRLCLRNQLADNPDFMIDLGDFLMTDKLENVSNQVPRDTITYRCELFREFYETNSHSVPTFIALGNHEGEAGWNLNNTANNIAVWDVIDRKKYFLNPSPDNFYTGDTTNNAFVGKRESYYSWVWGDALFVVIDPYWYTNPKPDSLHGWRWSLGKTQYDWLKKTLEDNDSVKFKFVFAHQLVGGDPDGRGGVEFADLYEWGGKNLDGSYGFTTNRPGWYRPIKDLLAEHRVNIFFHGHDHFFCKQEKACMVYQETPQPSHPNPSGTDVVTYADDYGYFQGLIQAASGHLKVTVDSLGVQVDYVRTYLPQDEDNAHHNRDVSATYYIGAKNCYDSTSFACLGVNINLTLNKTNPTLGQSNGSIVVAASPGTGFVYSLNNGPYQTNGTFNGLSAGVYSVVAKSTDTCYGYLSTTLSVDSGSTVVSDVLWNLNYQIQNGKVWPNPFSDRTRIDFNVAKSTKLYFAIYNEAGQLVKNWSYGNPVNAGNYAIFWDGRNKNGVQVSPGTYFYSIRGDGGTIVSGKMVYGRR